MSSPNSTPPNSIPPWLLGARRRVGPVLLAVALVFAIALIYLLYSQGSVALGRPIFYWALTLSLASLVIGLLVVIGQDRGDDGALSEYRLQVMTWGAITGLATALLGLALPFTTEYYAVFAGGLGDWREKPWGLIWTGLAFISGLVLLFLSLNLARGAERTSGLMRRLLYGYNVVLSSILLLLILLLVNVLSFARLRPFDVLGQTIDFTSSGVYTLGEPTRATLRSLREPLEVILMLPASGTAQKMEHLLELAGAYAPNLHWKSYDVHRNRSDIADLKKKYDLLETTGVLLVYGDQHEFVEATKLNEMDPRAGMDPRAAPEPRFVGENALLTAMRFLLEGKTKPRIHFLQGYGALELGQNDDLSRQKPDIGLGAVRAILESPQAGYDVQPLKLEGNTPVVPEEANLVVIPRVTDPLPQKVIDALLAFARGTGRKTKGKLIVLADVIREGDQIRPTGVETLVQSFGIHLGDKRLLALYGPNREDPRLLGVGPERYESLGAGLVRASAGSNPIAQDFWDRDNRMPFRMWDARAVERAEANPSNPTSYVLEPLLFPWYEQAIYPASSLQVNPEADAEYFRTHQEEFDKVRVGFVPVAMAVTEREAGQGAHGFSTSPRMLVFGDATWLSNYGVERTKRHADLFASCVNWLRERPIPTNLVKDRERPTYQLKVSANEFWNLTLLPGALLVLATIALGLGVWVVRRR